MFLQKYSLNKFFDTFFNFSLWNLSNFEFLYDEVAQISKWEIPKRANSAAVYISGYEWSLFEDKQTVTVRVCAQLQNAYDQTSTKMGFRNKVSN